MFKLSKLGIQGCAARETSNDTGEEAKDEGREPRRSVPLLPGPPRPLPPSTKASGAGSAEGEGAWHGPETPQRLGEPSATAGWQVCWKQKKTLWWNSQHKAGEKVSQFSFQLPLLVTGRASSA